MSTPGNWVRHSMERLGLRHPKPVRYTYLGDGKFEATGPDAPYAVLEDPYLTSLEARGHDPKKCPLCDPGSAVNRMLRGDE